MSYSPIRCFGGTGGHSGNFRPDSCSFQFTPCTSLHHQSTTINTPLLRKSASPSNSVATISTAVLKTPMACQHHHRLIVSVTSPIGNILHAASKPRLKRPFRSRVWWHKPLRSGFEILRHQQTSTLSSIGEAACPFRQPMTSQSLPHNPKPPVKAKVARHLLPQMPAMTIPLDLIWIHYQCHMPMSTQGQ